MRATVRVGFVTLGCDKNTVDSERMLARMMGAGATVAADPADADVVVVNTCGFIEAAREESIEAILDAARLKQQGRVRAVVATGCLVQRYRSELSDEMPEVDLFLGLTDADRLVPELRRRGLLHDRDVPTMERPLRVLSSRTRHTSYLKISEGCDHTCAFCAIPLMRGRHRSFALDEFDPFWERVQDLDVTGPSYLTGLLDCVGEIKRLVYDRMRSGNEKDAEKLFATMEEIYNAIYPFAVYDNVVASLRKKLDVARMLIEDVRAVVTEESRRNALMDAVGRFQAGKTAS